MSRQIDLSPVAQYIMTCGLGSVDNNKACVVAQAAIMDALSKGEEIKGLTDTLECACPVLRVLAIALNDVGWWESDAERTETLRPLIPLLLDSRRDPAITALRASRASDFAKSAAESAARYAKYAAKSAAESAAKYAEYAAKSAAESAAWYAEYAAKSAAWYAEYAAKYAEYAAKSAAESAAWYAEYAAWYAKSSAEYAKYAAYAKSLRPLRDELLRVWMECEAIQ